MASVFFFSPSLLIDLHLFLITFSTDFSCFQIPKKVSSTLSDSHVKDRLKKTSLSTREQMTSGMTEAVAKERTTNVEQWWSEQIDV